MISHIKIMKILVAMSGGVDSSIAAALLKEQGHDICGITMKLWDTEEDARSCCSKEDAQSARGVAEVLKIPHYTLNLMDDFKKSVIEDFINEYLECRTPNPCVNCNAFIKWGKLFSFAEHLGMEAIATGHYARIESDQERGYVLKKGFDKKKDQSYFLWGIQRTLFEKTLFPLGGIEKKRAREIARNMGLPSAERKESQEICFIPDNDYRSFIKDYASDRFSEIKTGDIVDPDEKVIGRHKGLPFYTIGQRKGLGALGPEPHFVIRLEKDKNRVVVGKEKDQYAKQMEVTHVNWLVPDPKDCFEATVKIRYNHPGVLCRVKKNDHGIEVSFDRDQKAVAPGQSAVFYKNDMIICGGRIEKAW